MNQHMAQLGASCSRSLMRLYQAVDWGCSRIWRFYYVGGLEHHFQAYWCGPTAPYQVSLSEGLSHNTTAGFPRVSEPRESVIRSLTPEQPHPATEWGTDKKAQQMHFNMGCWQVTLTSRIHARLPARLAWALSDLNHSSNFSSAQSYLPLLPLIRVDP